MKRREGSAVERSVKSSLLSLMIAVLAVAACAGVAADQIEDDQGVRRYGLRNGLEVVVVPTHEETMRHSIGASEDALQMWLILDAGMIDETDQTRGIAQICAAMSSQSVKGFDEETITAILTTQNEQAQDPKRTQGVQVILAQTIFSGHAPVGDADAMERVLKYYATVLDPDAWDAAREAGFERSQARLRERVEQMLDPMMRARQRWMERLLGHGTLGTRLDVPEPEEIDNLRLEDAIQFAHDTYRANRATLLIVGDVAGVDLDAMVTATMGQCPAGAQIERASTADGLGGESVIFEQEPGWDQHQAVLVWAEKTNKTPDTKDSLRAYVIDRVAEELIRRRIERLGIAQLGRDSEIAVDRFELGGRVKLMQWVVEREGTDPDTWHDSIGLLLSERERLARHGAQREEVVQARAGLLAGWHRDAEEWRTMGSRVRAQDYLWLLISERKIISPGRWDEVATELMSTIRDEEIVEAIRQLVKPDSLRVLVSSGGKSDQARAMQDELESFTRSMRSKQIGALDPDWMRSLGGDLLDDQRATSGPMQITQHPASGTWGGTLDNGVRIWTRPTGTSTRAELSVMLWGPMFADGSLSAAEIDAAMLAWITPSTEQRDAGWLAVYQETHGLDVQARRTVGGVRLTIEADADALGSALELMYVMLDRPMIDVEVFGRWAAEPSIQYGDDDPLDRALAQLYHPELLQRDDQRVTIDIAQRALARIVHNARIEVGIAGAIDPAAALEQASGMLGMLSPREPLSEQSQTDKQTDGRRSQFRNQRETRVHGENQALLLGARGGSMGDLANLRATILAVMVLDQHLEREANQIGLPEEDLDAQVFMSEALGNQWAMMIRIGSDDPTIHEERAREIMHQLSIDGIDAEELAAVQDRLVASIDRYFDRPGYWSSRLSTLGVHGRTVDDLWNIRDGYRAVTAEQASKALQDTIERGDWFRVLIEPERAPTAK